MTAKDHICILNHNMELNAEAYYTGSPKISDAEYDRLEAQLIGLVAANPQFAKFATMLNKVGNVKNSVARIKHARPMLSIENYYTTISFLNASATYGPDLLMEPKRDGISCELKYLNGKLAQAVTRGDGEAGEDMTEQVMACKAIPKILNNYDSKKFPEDIRIRGELVMRNSELARINALGGKQYSNTRNLVAGTMKQQDMSIVASREILVMPWDMYSPDQDDLLPDSALLRMDLTSLFGFPMYEGVGYRMTHIADPAKFQEKLDIMLRSNAASDITADGVVMKADSHKLRNKLGVGSKFTKYQHCFKPQNLAAETTVLDIEYGLGRTGKITPVAILKPVMLGGAQISRVSCTNETWIKNLGLMIGAKVMVLRSGDVIPYITSVISTKGATPIVFPTHCPSCNSKLQFDSTDLIVQRFCENSLCPGKAAEQFAYIGHRSTLEIDNLGGAMAEELVDIFDITNIVELFEFANKTNANIKSTGEATIAKSLKVRGFHSGVNAVKMVKSLEKAKTATWERWISALSIPFIGHSLGEDISKALNLTANDMGNLPKLLLKMPELNLGKLGPVKTASIVDWAKNKKNVAMCVALFNAGVRPTPLVAKVANTAGKLAGIAFCMTGELSLGTRKVIGAKLIALGAEELSDVKSNCNLLIVGENPGSKLAKAEKKGVKIVHEDWVKTQLGI